MKINQLFSGLTAKKAYITGNLIVGKTLTDIDLEDSEIELLTIESCLLSNSCMEKTTLSSLTIRDTHFSDINMVANELFLINFEGFTTNKTLFNKCVFKENEIGLNTIWSDTQFIDCVFEECLFEHTRFDGCIFRRCTFLKCVFDGIVDPRSSEEDRTTQVRFVNCIFDDTKFLKCIFNRRTTPTYTYVTNVLNAISTVFEKTQAITPIGFEHCNLNGLDVDKVEDQHIIGRTWATNIKDLNLQDTKTKIETSEKPPLIKETPKGEKETEYIDPYEDCYSDMEGYLSYINAKTQDTRKQSKDNWLCAFHSEEL